VKNESNPEPVDVAVIGAGVAGLAAATYARLAGLSVRVFERHFIPGGLCTSWKRKGYLFDYCMDWFMGNGEKHAAYRFWRDLGVIAALRFRPIESFGRYVGADGRAFTLYTDPDRLEEEVRSLSPADLPRMRKFCRAVRKGRSFVMGQMSFAPANLPYLLKSMPAILAMSAWASTPVKGWCAGFADPLIREGFPALVGEGVTMTGPVVAFGMMNAGNAAFPLGGSIRIAEAIEARARELGAEFAYRLGAKRIVLEDGKAIGLELDDGRFQACRRVIAACDAKGTIDGLLGGSADSSAYDAEFARGSVYGGIVQVSVGVRLDPAWGLAEAPKNLNLPLDEPIVVDGTPMARIAIQQSARDPSAAPSGCASFIARFGADYDRWKALGRGTPAYAAEKARILDETVGALDRIFSGFRGRVEASDVSTPLSCERYTGNWRGSFMGWMLTAERMKELMRGRKLPKTLRGARGVYLAGQWTEPGGGIPPSAMSGRDAVRLMLKDGLGR